MSCILLRDRGTGSQSSVCCVTRRWESSCLNALRGSLDLKERFHIDGTSFQNGNLPLIDVEVNYSPFQNVISWKSFPRFVEEISADVEIKSCYTYWTLTWLLYLLSFRWTGKWKRESVSPPHPPARVQFSFGVDHDVGGGRVVVSRSKGQIFKSSGFDSPGGALLLP